MSMTALEIIENALRNINVLYTGQSSSSAQRTECLEVLQVMLRSWAARALMTHYIVEGEALTTVAGTAAYTIGSAGDVNTVRPVRILNAYFREGSRDYPVEIIQAGEYARVWDKADTQRPQKLWYNPVYPLGEIKIWPTGAGTMYLDSQKQLTEPTAVTDTMSFAPEFDEAMAFNLAVRLAPRYNKPVGKPLDSLASTSLRRIKIVNAALSVEPVAPEVLALSQARFSIENC